MYRNDDNVSDINRTDTWIARRSIPSRSLNRSRHKHFFSLVFYRWNRVGILLLFIDNFVYDKRDNVSILDRFERKKLIK